MSITEKTIWCLWLQGWDNAPDLVKSCKASWKKYNTDWDAYFLDAESMPEFLGDCPFFFDVRTREMSPAALSDIIRHELLTRHGGIWADATTYCMRPLDEWINPAATTGFFAFNRPGPDRMISTWFLAAERESYITRTWLERSYAYWQNRTTSDQYFWSHHLFGDLYQDDQKFREIWDATPKISADGPHSFAPYEKHLLEHVSDFHRDVVDMVQTPLLKLTHRVDHDAGREGTVYRWLCERMGVEAQ